MTETTYRSFKLHEAPRDPVYERIIALLKIEAFWDGSGVIEDLGDAVERAALEIGMDPHAAARVLGLRLSPHRDREGHYSGLLAVSPDGVRACYLDECQHCPGYVPEPWRPRSPAQKEGTAS